MGLDLIVLVWCLVGISVAKAQLPPSITVEGPEEEIYRPDTSYELPCRASGNPAPQYEWTKDGVTMQYLSSYRIQMAEDNGTLYFDPINILHEGRYQCRAFNQHGQTLSRVTNLRRAVLTPYQQTTPQAFHGREGESFILPCQDTYSVPSATFSWGLTDGQSDQTPQKIELTSRMVIDEKGNLYFAYLTPDDEQDERIYKCMAFNPILFSSTGGSDSRLTVTPNPGRNHSSELMVSSESPKVMLLNSNDYLKCFFKGKPLPGIAWNRKHAALPAGRTQKKDHDTELHIQRVQWQDEGVYECTGTNGIGPPAIHEIQVDVQAKPEFLPGKWPRNVNVTVRDTVIFECETSAEPDAQIQWLINGEPVEQMDADDRWRMSEDGSSFTIHDVCRDCEGGGSDLMVIQCNASNTHGYAFASGYLNVLEPTIITLAPSSQTFNGSSDEAIIFSCEASTDNATELIMDWYHNDTLLYFTRNSRHSIQGNGSLILDVSDMDVEDVRQQLEGTYRCQATNGFSEDWASARLSVRLPGHERMQSIPLAPESSSTFDMWWLAVIGLVILLAVVLALFYYRNKTANQEANINQTKNSSGIHREKLADSSGTDGKPKSDRRRTTFF